MSGRSDYCDIVHAKEVREAQDGTSGWDAGWGRFVICWSEGVGECSSDAVDDCGISVRCWEVRSSSSRWWCTNWTLVCRWWNCNRRKNGCSVDVLRFID